jgi:hypothetical protein
MVNRLTKHLLTAAAILFASTVSAQTGLWKDETGKPVPETQSRKSTNGFAGWLLVTPDEDWQAKWNTPSNTVPKFNEAKDVPRGKKLFVLIFFANPKVDAAGMADIVCDLKVTRPNRSASIDQKGVTCFNGRIMGNSYNMYLSVPVIAFVGEPADPSGEWIVEVKLQDNARSVSLPLRTSFKLR